MDKHRKQPRAVVREINGQIVLDDPDAFAVAMAVGKHNCKGTLEANADRVAHFKQRMVDRGLTGKEVVIVVVNVDDANGEVLAEALMPGQDWQAIRDRGEVPFARGLAAREGIREFVSLFDGDAERKMQEMAEEVVAVVVDHGVAEVFVV